MLGRVTDAVGEQPLQPAPRRGSWELLPLGKGHFPGRGEGCGTGAGGPAKLMCDAGGGPGGGAERGATVPAPGRVLGEGGWRGGHGAADTGPGARAGEACQEGLSCRPHSLAAPAGPAVSGAPGVRGCTTPDTCQGGSQQTQCDRVSSRDVMLSILSPRVPSSPPCRVAGGSVRGGCPQGHSAEAPHQPGARRPGHW